MMVKTFDILNLDIIVLQRENRKSEFVEKTQFFCCIYFACCFNRYIKRGKIFITLFKFDNALKKLVFIFIIFSVFHHLQIDVEARH